MGAAAADCRRLSSRAICSFASSPFFRLSSSSCSSLLIANASCSCSSSSPADVGRRDSSSDSRPVPAPPYHTTHCLQPTGTRHATFKTCPSPTLPHNTLPSTNGNKARNLQDLSQPHLTTQHTAFNQQEQGTQPSRPVPAPSYHTTHCLQPDTNKISNLLCSRMKY